MNTNLKNKLTTLPTSPGVYFFYNEAGKIIYIGKASILKRRVSSYFQKNHRDYKTPLLVKNIHSVEWIVASSEIEALFLEAEYIKRHKPIYNVDLKDDKNFIYIKVTAQEDFPIVTLVRRPNDDKARYFGPFVAGYQVRQALRYLRRIFPYYSKPASAYQSKLDYQIGVLPPPDISRAQYKSNIRKLMLVFSGKSEYLANSLEKDMKKLAKSKNYEAAAGLRNQFLALKGLSTKIVFGKEETFDISLDKAMAELTSTIGLRGIPKRIECYDISNFAGGDAVSSMVVFTDGLPDQKQYRHFKMNTPGPNDFAMMQETLLRRFSKRNASWPKPDLIIVDGGKGQLSSALVVLDDLKINIPIVGLAKRYETIIQKSSTRPVKAAGDITQPQQEYLSFNFDDKLTVLHLVQRIRDEAHRFAVSYHTVVRKKRTQKSELDSINGIGPVARKKLVGAFGSVRGIKIATRAEIAKVVGPAKAKIIDESLGLKG